MVQNKDKNTNLLAGQTRWKGLYWLVIAMLVLQIIVYYFLTLHFA